MRCARLLFALSMLPAPMLPAQLLVARAAQPADSVPSSISVAEAEGSRWPRAARNNGASPAPGITVGGTSERKCVDVDRVNVARSGDFVAGPFQRYNEIWSQGYGKLWWEPAVLSGRDTLPLTVRVTRLDAPGTAAVFSQPFLAHGVAPPSNTRTSPDFYPSGIHVATAGRWLFVATAGPNWGCYVLTVGVPKPALR
jgi:hypothetical protein